MSDVTNKPQPYHKVPSDLLQKVANYLNAQPLGEVHQLFHALCACEGPFIDPCAKQSDSKSKSKTPEQRKE